MTLVTCSRDNDDATSRGVIERLFEAALPPRRRLSQGAADVDHPRASVDAIDDRPGQLVWRRAWYWSVFCCMFVKDGAYEKGAVGTDSQRSRPSLAQQHAGDERAVIACHAIDVRAGAVVRPCDFSDIRLSQIAMGSVDGTVDEPNGNLRPAAGECHQRRQANQIERSNVAADRRWTHRCQPFPSHAEVGTLHTQVDPPSSKESAKQR